MVSRVDKSRFLVEPGKKIRLSDFDAADTNLMPEEAKARVKIEQDVQKLADLQARLYAEHQRAVLIVLQGMDASGKDGTIKHVMTGFNPLGCTVAAFKVPAGEELDHHFLWRVERVMPRKGHI